MRIKNFVKENLGFLALFLMFLTSSALVMTACQPTVTPTSAGVATVTPTPQNTPNQGNNSLPNLSAGNIAITGICMNGNSQFSFVSTVALTSGQVIYFTDYSYDNTANSGVGGLVDESVTVTSGATTVTDGTISYTVGATGLAAYTQVVVGSAAAQDNFPDGGSPLNVAGDRGVTYMYLNHNGNGTKILAYTVSAGVTAYVAGVIFGPDTWASSMPVTEFWDSYMPPGLSSSNTTDLSGLWGGAANLSQYGSSTAIGPSPAGNSDVDDNAIVSCESTLATLVAPGNWQGDGDETSSHVSLWNTGTPGAPNPMTSCTVGTDGGYGGSI